MNAIEIQQSLLMAIKEQQDELSYYHPNAVVSAFYRAILRAFLRNITTSTQINDIRELVVTSIEDSQPDFRNHLLSLLDEYIVHNANIQTPQEEIRIDKYIESKIPPTWEDESLSTIISGISSILKNSQFLDNWAKEMPPKQWEGIAQALNRTAQYFNEFTWLKEKIDQLQKQFVEQEALALMTLPPEQWLSAPPSFELTARQRAFIEAVKTWHLGELAKVEKQASRWKWAARIIFMLLIILLSGAVISIIYGIQSRMIAQERANFAATNAAIAGEVAKIAATDVFAAGTAKVESTRSKATAQIAATEVKNLSANQIAAQALSNLEDNYSLALLLSIEAYQRLDTPQTKSALFNTVFFSPFLKQTFYGHYGGIIDAVFHPDQSTLISLGADNQIILWDITSNSVGYKSYIENNGKISTFALSQDGNIFALGMEDGKIQLKDFSSIQQTKKTIQAHTGAVNHLIFDHQSKILASVGEDQVIQLWDAQNGASLRTIKPNHKYTITSLVFSSDDQFLFSSGLDGNVFAWNAKNGSYYGKAFSNAVGMIWQIAIDQSGRLLAAATNNGAIYFWDLNKWKMYSKPLISNKQENILALRFVDNGKYLISTTESSVSIWQISVDEQGNLGGKEIIQLQFDNYKPIKNLAVDAHEKYLALISPSLTEIPLYSITGLINGQMEGVQFLNGLSDQPVSSVSFNPKNPSQLASGSWDKTIKIWDIKNDLSKNQFLPSKVLEGSEGYVLRVTYSEDGKTLASAGTDNTIRLWNTDDWKQTGNLQGHTQWIRALTFDESGRFLFSAGWDQELRIWDVIHKKLIGNPIKVNEGAFYDLVFYKTGGEQDFLFASSDGTEKNPSLHKWLINSSGQLQAQSSFGPSESTYAISLDPNQKILAAGGKSRVITLWNVENEQQIGAPLIGHQGDILSLSFSPDGKILASGSADNKIILWDMETKMPLGKPLEAHKGFVYSVVFRDDSKILASAGSDGKILLWDVDPQEWIKRACQKAGRNLSAEEWSKFFGNQPYQKTCPTNP